MLKFYFLFLTIFWGLNAQPSIAQAATCGELYDKKLYEEAAPVCENENEAFKLGRIYSELKKCEKSIEWYEKSGSSGAYYNLAIIHAFDEGLCTQNLEKAKIYIDKAIAKHPTLRSWYISGLIIKKQNKLSNFDTPNEDAFFAFLEAIFVEVNSIREFDREIIDLLMDEIDMYVKENPSSFETIITKLKKQPSTDELFEMVMQNYKKIIKLNSSLANDIAEILDREIKRENYRAVGFKAEMLKDGFGYVEDTFEAYRLYLISASKGDKKAVKEKNKLGEKLSAEQRIKAQCLAKKGLNLNFLDKLMC